MGDTAMRFRSVTLRIVSSSKSPGTVQIYGEWEMDIL